VFELVNDGDRLHTTVIRKVKIVSVKAKIEPLQDAIEPIDSMALRGIVRTDSAGGTLRKETFDFS